LGPFFTSEILHKGKFLKRNWLQIPYFVGKKSPNFTKRKITTLGLAL
jgi:hypothetical protein